MSRKRKKHEHEEVELNMAAMLDMAFQLLTFFILTFKPAPIEGQIALRMPPPAPVTNTKGQALGSDESNKNPLEGLETLVVTVMSSKEGNIASMGVGEDGFNSLPKLEEHLRKILGDPGNPFKQVVLNIGSGLKYSELMRVVDVCTRQKMASGERLTKLSFVELPDGSSLK